MRTYPYARISFLLRDLLQAEQSGDQIPGGVRFSAPV